ncbi:hypothetical protein SeLEV6574_g02193 [Synchytrium endobioticum]|nr:hypothetical protein SeLEV6574_g02193 [Synchytrium endobioticum]
MTFSNGIIPVSSHQYDDLRTQTSLFLREFDAWILSKKNEYVQSREHRQRTLMMDSDNREKITKQIESCLAKAAEISSDYDIQKRNIESSSKLLDTLKQSATERSHAQEELQFKVDNMTADIKRRKHALEKRRRHRFEEIQNTQAELRAYEERLKLHIGSIGEDKIWIKYTHICEADVNRVYQFVVEFRQKAYLVSDCHPLVDDLDANLRLLNQTRDFYDFLKRMRRSFIEHASS